MTLRLVLMGTSPFLLPSLSVLAASRHDILAVYTQPPRPAGRGHKERRSAVHERAAELGLPIFTPASLRKSDIQAQFEDLRADLAIVGAYGLLLPRPILDAPRLGCINLHGSILPRWRGAAPVQRAIQAGDPVTGISIFQMEEGLDTGPVLATREVVITPELDAGTLHDRLADTAAAMLPDLLDDLESGRARAVPQPEDGVTYASKVSKEDGHIDFTASAEAVDRQIRAFTPSPGAFAFLGEERLLIRKAHPVTAQGTPATVIAYPLTIGCGRDAIMVDTVQRSGRKPMSATELQRGFPIPLGSRFA